MIILITGASHTGKTVLAQKLLENIFDQQMHMWIKEANSEFIDRFQQNQIIRQGYECFSVMEKKR